jgi:membrane protein DedA with SNARE-associated domain
MPRSRSRLARCRVGLECFVNLVSFGELQELVSAHGYWAVALIVGLESMGLPLPGETILVLAAIYAATEPSFNIGVVIAVAAFGAIVGDNAGYWLGLRYGYALLLRYGERIGMFEARIKLGQYLYLKHGAKVVFLGRFVALLRILAAFLAGVNRMPCARVSDRQCQWWHHLGRGVRHWRLLFW